MDALPDQFSIPAPARVSRSSNSVSQSDTSPELLAASATAPPVAQGVACVGVPVTVADQEPSPAELTARTCTSYCRPPSRPVNS